VPDFRFQIPEGDLGEWGKLSENVVCCGGGMYNVPVYVLAEETLRGVLDALMRKKNTVIR
jgi:hypothetical protein